MLRIHDVAIERHGGLPGVRDDGALDSAVFRPQNFFLYENERNIFMLAALYAEGIMANNHPFHDGNKRTGYASAAMFLSNNGHILKKGDSAKRVSFFEQVAAGGVPIEKPARFYSEHTRKRR